MAGRKREHLNEVLRQKLSTILHREANDPRFAHVTITDVDLAKDMSFARVSVATYQSDVEPEPLIESLNRAAGFFSRTLSRSLETRHTPRLAFFYDHGFDYAQEIEILLKETHDEGA